MDSSKCWINICPECGKSVEILNGDFEFSMELHKQSHKSLNYVNNAVDRNLDYSAEKAESATKLNWNYCNDCKEDIEIINNDARLSFQLHAQKHKLDNTDAASDHSSTSSGKGKLSQSTTKTKEKDQAQPVLTSILEAVFHTMPIGLKAHQGFVSEQGCSKAICNLCQITIEPIFSVSEHLKTKLHEDNTIQVIKTKLPSELHYQMEFISFYGSNLCCNLCRCKVELCSNNLYETVVNIFAHNAGKGHLSKKTASKDCNQFDKTLVILKSLALINPVVNENQHLIEHKMNPYFKCKPCETQIAYSENQNEMISNFTDHFNSPDHNKYLSAESLLNKWNGLNITQKENHNFVVSRQSIYCSSCNRVVGTNLDQLLAHVRGNSTLYGKGQSQSVPEVQRPHLQNVYTGNCSSSKEENVRSNIKEAANNRSMFQASQEQNTSAKLRRLLQSLPVQFRNVITENQKGEAVCLVCKCIIPATTYNLTTHLNGSSHAKKQDEANLNKKSVNRTQPPTTLGAQVKEFHANFDREFDELARTNHLVARNRKYFVKYKDGNNYICGLCGVIIQLDINSFQKSIFVHLTSQDHLYKVQLKEEMSQLLPRHKDTLVRELFELIPLSFQKDLKFIKAPEGVNFVFCEICCLKIPRHRTCLIEHLEGAYHETSIERLGKIQDKTQPDDINDLFQELLRSNREIKMNSKYLVQQNDDYFCRLCKAVIKQSYDMSLFKQNILGHIFEKKHKNKIENEFNHMLDKVQLLSAVVKNNRMFLRKENDKVFCILCSCQLSLADSDDALRHNLEVHFLGNLHSSRKLESEKSSSGPQLGTNTSLSFAENSYSQNPYL